MLKDWCAQSESIQNDWKFLPVREIVDFCVKEFVKIVIPDKSQEQQPSST